jgi:KaiC/GvpD/RAD55 family RecA-like ATPase
MFILTTDMGIIPEKGELALRSLVDGVVQFRSTYTGNKLIRYINIPKMRGVLPLDQMVPYKVTSEGIVLDVRERVG